MAVQPRSLELLDKARVPAEQARAIVGAIEIEIDGVRDTLATKQDVLALHQDMELVRKDVENVRKEVDSVRKEVDGVRKEVDGVRKDVESVRNDVESVRREVSGLRDGLGDRINGVRGELVAEIHISAERTTRQLIAMTLTLMSALVGIFLVLLTHSMR